MKKMIGGLMVALVMLASCEKNNCYTCNLVIRDGGEVYSSRRLQKICRIKKKDLDNMYKDSTRTYEGQNKYKGNIKVTFSQGVECTKDNYW